MTNQQQEHTLECLDDRLRTAEDTNAFLNLYPNACRNCYAWGFEIVVIDVAPEGSNMRMPLTQLETCPQCLGAEEPKCPRCGTVYPPGIDPKKPPDCAECGRRDMERGYPTPIVFCGCPVR